MFADINMPVMNGIKLIERMSEEGMIESVPVVIVSNEGIRQRINGLRARGVRSYLRKLFTSQSLKEVIV